MFFSHKFKGTGLRYLVATSIQRGDIVWLDGPVPPGQINDVMQLRFALINFLEEHERVEADDGYIGEAPLHVKCPKSFTFDAQMAAMARRLASRHETVNK